MQHNNNNNNDKSNNNSNDNNLLFIGLVGKVVDGDGQEDVEEDEVAADEEDDEVDASDDSRRLDPAVRVDSVVHHRVPILAGQNLESIDRSMNQPVH